MGRFLQRLLASVVVVMGLTSCGEVGREVVMDISGDALSSIDTQGSEDIALPEGDSKPNEDLAHIDLLDAQDETVDLYQPDELTPDLFPDETCVPDCGERGCGDDGCGGSCGECAENSVCSEAGLCEELTPACAELCNQFDCGEQAASDGSVCFCGVCATGSFCNPQGLCEEEIVCVPQCDGMECGDNGCEGSCGTCGEGSICINHMCILETDPCAIACASFECGIYFADDNAECDCGSCLADEDCVNGECIVICVANCTGKVCGPDGCGSTCGTCAAGTQCNSVGQCISTCLPSCTGKVCGPDGCGSTCGTCATGTQCNSVGQCISTCVPSCTGKVCGPDGCGSTCGTCTYGVCTAAGQCQCTPACAGKECGPNGCGGVCGTCPSSAECLNGTCMTGGCDVQELEFADTLPYQKITYLEFGANGQPGNGLDVDGNPATCAPSGSCSGGIDNSFASLMNLVGPYLGSSNPFENLLESGNLILLMEPLGYNNWGTAFTMGWYLGDVQGSCNFQQSYCSYWVLPESIDPETCTPYIFFDPVVMQNNVIQGGGAASNFGLTMEFSGVPIYLQIHMAQIYGQMVSVPGGHMAINEGIIGGAIRTQDLFDAILDLPPGTLPMDPNMVVNLLSGVLKKDIDTDGDGVKDAASVSIKFNSIEGMILGVQ